MDAAVAFLVLVLPALFAGVSLWWTAAAAVLLGLAVAPLTQRQEVDGLARRDAARGTDGPPGSTGDRDRRLGDDGDDEIDLRDPE